MSDTPWEPPLAGTEAEHLLGALDRQRATFRWKVDGLDADGMRRRIGASSLSLGGLTKHLAVVEDQKSTVCLTGDPLPSVRDDNGWDDDRDWEITSAGDNTPAELHTLYDDAVSRSRSRTQAAVAGGGLDQLIELSMPDGTHASLRRLLFDLLEEYGSHVGHADLLREAVDARVGEVPPPGWTPGTMP